MTQRPHAVLITMPHSHYAEKARWALDWLALPYREAPHVPLLHRLSTTRHGGQGVPVLLDGSRRLCDSTEILLHLDTVAGSDRLFPREPASRQDVAALEARFDDALGPHARRWAYAHFLPHRRALRTMMSRGVPRWESLLLPLMMPVVVPLVRAAFRITPEGAERSRHRVWEVFGEVEERLSEGRAYLVSEQFSAADLTFAALASLCAAPVRARAAAPAL